MPSNPNVHDGFAGVSTLAKLLHRRLTHRVRCVPVFTRVITQLFDAVFLVMPVSHIRFQFVAPPPNHALQRTAASRLGFNRAVSWPPSLSLIR